MESGETRLLWQVLQAEMPDLPAELLSAPSSRAAMAEIVDRCAQVTGGLGALAQAVELLRPGSDESARLRELAGQLTPSAGDIDALRGIVGDVVVPDLAELAREATGGPLEWAGEDVVDTYLELFELSADKRSLTPLIFLELVAGRTPAVQDALREWTNRQAALLEVRYELTRFRNERFPRPAVRETLTLMISISEAEDDEDQYLLAAWRQRDPHEWPPPRGPVVRASRANLEAAVDAIVIDAETAWAAHAGDIRVEFLLPHSLLHLPIAEWRTELASAAPIPLTLQYPVIVRSLERMRSPHWHRAWRMRAKRLSLSNSADNLFLLPRERADPLRDFAVLSDERWTAVAIDTPPAGGPAALSDELASVLRTGIPVVVWHRDGTAEAAAEAVRELMGDTPLNELPQRVAEARRDALRDPANAPAHDLVVLWDDPVRVVSATELDLTGTEVEH
ncbi:hypothetical protein [Amycolatopsis sp. NPDC051102]|uniref:VMAP-C domain-containing protein n=1 Tax=Amycolatopsis sp. NPDC051102 TaxID=3155163 RepID=UPI0034440AF5